MLKPKSATKLINELVEKTKLAGLKLYAFPESWMGIPGEVIRATKQKGADAKIVVMRLGQKAFITLNDNSVTESLDKKDSSKASAWLETNEGERLHIMAMAEEGDQTLLRAKKRES